MTTALETKRAAEIVRLHEEIGEHLRTSLDKAIRIGELLEAQKAELEHGQWGPWLAEHVSFSDRAAREYMTFYRERARLISAHCADFTDARRLLAGPRGWSELTAEEFISRLHEKTLGELVFSSHDDAHACIQWILALCKADIQREDVDIERLTFWSDTMLEIGQDIAGLILEMQAKRGELCAAE